MFWNNLGSASTRALGNVFEPGCEPLYALTPASVQIRCGTVSRTKIQVYFNPEVSGPVTRDTDTESWFGPAWYSQFPYLTLKTFKALRPMDCGLLLSKFIANPESRQ